VSLTPGRGAAYEVAFNDADGAPLSGNTSYKLTLPPDIPAELFWSLTLYEAENASGLATDARRFPSLGSRDNPVENADGTIDLYVGPKAPEGKKRTGWPPLRGAASLPSCASTVRARGQSTTAGSRETSRELIEGLLRADKKQLVAAYRHAFA
jgi:hypothetical protein